MSNIISRLGVVLGLNSAEFVKGLDTATKKLSDFANSASVYGAAAATALTAASVAALKYADEIVDVAAANDVAVDSVIKLSNALANSGGKADNAGKFLASFTSYVDKAASGSDEAQKSFAKAGISLRDLAKLDTEQLFTKAAQNIGQISDPLTRNALAMEIFGRAAKGVDFTSLASGISAMSSATEEQAKALKDAAEMYDLFAQTGRDALQIIAVELGPPLKATIDYMTNLGAETKVFGEVAKTVFQTVAILGMNLGYVFKTIGTEIGGMAAQVAALMRFDFDGFRQIHREMVADAEKARRELDAAEKRVMGGGGGAGGGAGGVGDGRRGMAVPSIAAQVAEWSNADKREIQASKEAKEQQKKLDLMRQELALAKVISEIDQKRIALQLEEILLGKSFFDLLSGRLATEEQIAKIENKRKVDLIQNKDATKQLKDGINEAADAEIRRLRALQEGKEKIAQQRMEYELLLTQIENSSDFMRSEKRGSAEASAVAVANAIDKANRQFALGQSIDEQNRQINLANERIKYEMQLAGFTQRRRVELMALYDLEVQINEFQRNARQLGVDEDIIQRRTEEIKNAELATIRLQEAQKNAQSSFVYGWQEAFNSYLDDATNAARVAGSMFSSITGNMEAALERFVKTGKLQFADLARSIIQDIIAIQLKAQASALFSAIVRGAGIKLFGSEPGLSQYSLNYGSTSSLGLQARAGGGDISSGQPYLVGERGPELVVPRSAGTVIPNHSLAGAMGGGPSVVYNGPYIANMSAIDTQSGLAFLAKNKQGVWAANQSAQRSLPVSR